MAERRLGSRPGRYAVLGHPVTHSLSPVIHQRFAESTGHVLTYTAIDLMPENFGAFWTRGEGAHLDGANVTMPLKHLAFKLADELSDDAGLAGSVNTLIRTPQGMRGETTDGEGLIRDLSENLGWPLKGKRILIIGAGGAGRAIAFPVARCQAKQLCVANRSPDRAESVAEKLVSGGFSARACGLDQLQEMDAFDGIIHASSAGHSHTLSFPQNLINANTWCYDLSYGQAAAPFLKWARQNRAGRVSDGLGMLVEQAAESFFLWRGVRPETPPVLAFLRNRSGAKPVPD